MSTMRVNLLSLGLDHLCLILLAISDRIGLQGAVLSTSATLCCRICCRTLGFSNSFWILPMIESASSLCCLCLTCPSYLTHESRTCFASRAKAVFCSSSKACASSLAVSFKLHQRAADSPSYSMKLTFDTSKSCLVTSTTLSSCLTFSILDLTALVWSVLAAFRISFCFWIWPFAHSLYIGPPYFPAA